MKNKRYVRECNYHYYNLVYLLLYLCEDIIFNVHTMIFLYVTFIGYKLEILPAANPICHSSYVLLGSVRLWLPVPSRNLSFNCFSTFRVFLKVPKSSNTYYVLNLKYYNCTVSTELINAKDSSLLRCSWRRLVTNDCYT